MTKNWSDLNVCPACKAKLSASNISRVGVSFYDDGHLMENRAGINVPICNHCKQAYDDGNLALRLTPDSELVIKTPGMLEVVSSTFSLVPYVRCACCGKEPHEIVEYQAMVEEEPEYYESAVQAVIVNEGTYNPYTGGFYCTSCYIKKGMPTGVCNEVYKG